MKVATILDMPGATMELYEQLFEVHGDRIADISLMHFAHQYEGGLRIIEVWPSQEVWDEHYAQMTEASKALGIPYSVEVVPAFRHFHKHHAHK